MEDLGDDGSDWRASNMHAIGLSLSDILKNSEHIFYIITIG
jgi:hypothetical protein